MDLNDLPGQMVLPFSGAYDPTDPGPLPILPGAVVRVLAPGPLLGRELVVSVRMQEPGIVWAHDADGFDCPFHPDELEVLAEATRSAKADRRRKRKWGF